MEDDEEDPDAGKSLYQTIRETSTLCYCCPCFRRNNDENAEEDADQDEEEEYAYTVALS